MPAPPATADPVGAAASGRCPRCGQGELFEGWLKIRPSCAACGQDFSFADSGDGPAFFLTLGAGLFAMVVAGLCVVLGFPPAAILVVTLLLTTVAMFAALRPAKGLMIGLQYRYQAGEGRSE